MSDKNFILILILIFFCNCEKKKTTADTSVEIISINPRDAKEYINLSEIADSVKCIKLQTDSNDVMGRVREIIVKKKYIYAVDISQQMIFVFDKEGKFVSKLNKRGGGPDEYLHIGPVFIEDDEKHIELVNFKGNKTVLLKYSNISFELLKTSPFPDLNYNACKRNGDYYYFALQQLDNIINGKKTNAGLAIVDSKNKIKVLFDKNIKTDNMSFSPNSESFTKNKNNKLFVSIMYDNTFYQCDKDIVKPVFTVDFGKYSMDNAFALKSTKEQMDYIQTINGLVSFPVLNINDSDIMSFSYYFKQDNEKRMYREKDFQQYIQFKKTNKVYHTHQFKNDITNFPSHIYISSYFFNCVHEVWFENYLVDIILPNYYFSDNQIDKIFVDGIGEISEDDNPIIIFIKLKNELISI